MSKAGRVRRSPSGGGAAPMMLTHEEEEGETVAFIGPSSEGGEEDQLGPASAPDETIALR